MAQPPYCPTPGLTIGSVLRGRYRLARELAAGESSVSYLAQDVEHQGRLVVLKLVTVSEEIRDRLRREAPAILGLEHDHVARLIDCFESGDRDVLVSEHLDGRQLTAHVATSGPLAADEVAAIGRGVALALQAAHRRGLLHRGVSPRTILLARETRARLIDFGVADIDGEREFRAPEVTAGQGAEARADLYGLGLTLYLLLTGELPPGPRGESAPPPSADGHRPSRVRSAVPAWLDAAVAQATAALPADRFPSAGRLAEALTPGPLARQPGALGGVG